MQWWKKGARRASPQQYHAPSCDFCSTLLVPTCALQKKRAVELHMEKNAMANYDDISYGLLSLPPYEQYARSQSELAAIKDQVFCHFACPICQEPSTS